MNLQASDPLAREVVAAIRAGDTGALDRLLAGNPELATARIAQCGAERTLLHIATDWPGRFPNGPEVIGTLVAAGADVNARLHGGDAPETPLHWAASGNNVEVLDALLDLGADIEADGAIIGGRTAVSDAAAFGQWKAAARLIERGAGTGLWESATLGLQSRVTLEFATTIPSQQDINGAFWGACHGGQLAAAQILLERGADPNWVGWDGLTALDAARRSDADDVADWLVTQGALSASEFGQD